MIARIVVSGAALLVASLLVPGIQLRAHTPLQAILVLGVFALVFGLVNSYLRPLLKILALPLNLLTLGLFSFATNAGLLLLVAWIADQIVEKPLIRLGSFPPDVNAETLTAAVLGSVVISAASTVMSLLTPDA